MAIPNAAITVTPAGAGGSAAVGARSDVNGRWSVTMPSRSAEYYVTVIAIGWVQQRLTVKSAGGATPVTADVALKRAPVVLGAVRVTEQRRQPPRPETLVGGDIAGTEKGILAASEVFAAADQGDLMGMISQVPGITVVSDPSNGLPSFSVLGLSGSQNNVVLNGLAFGGSDVPRDIVGLVRVSSNAYDVSRGGFSGAQLSVTQVPGGNFRSRLVHATLDGPGLQMTDHTGRQLGQQYTNLQLSGNAVGPIVLDRLFYNVSVQGGRRFSDLTSLLTGDPATLARLGVSQDSVSAVVHAASLLGIPMSAAAIPSRRQTDNASLLGRFDWTPSQTVDASLTTSLRRSKSAASFVGSTALPGHGGDLTRYGGDVTAELSTLIDSTFLNDLRIGAHTDVSDAAPYVNLPDARVLVTSQLADSTTGLTSLVLGGNAGLPRYTRTSGAELWNQLIWNSLDNKHHWRATADARLDRLAQNEGANTRGTFVYNSIADVEANRPASFTRSFITQDMVAGVQTASLGVGDQWRMTDRVSVTYGARVDANRISTALQYNPTIDNVFHLRTDHAPSGAAVSPRASFSWGIGNNGTTGIPGFGAPWGFLSGGVGLFRNDVRPNLIAPVIANTGLPGGIGQLLCIGGAVPTPDFSAYAQNPASIPVACTTGATASFVSNQPSVSLIDPSFEPQSSWRGNLSFRGPFVTKLIRFTTDVTYSLNQHQQTPIDVNFQPVVRGQIHNEANRPSFALSSSIVPTTGAVTNVDSRLSPLFSSVNAVRSDLESRSTQYTFALQPGGLGTINTRWSVSYVYSDVREQVRGFGGTTAGNPLDVEWGRGAVSPRHAVNINLYRRFGSLFSMALTGRATSGIAYTPLVAGDINGDGFSNDRAYVFDPATVGDATISSGMSKLLASASPRVRNCLTRQFSTIAGRSSCEGPWMATASATMVLNPAKLGWDNRTQLTLNFANPLVGIDQLMHGSSHMQGWGQPAVPDNTLLRVTGYDPTSGRYRYDVNQRFGDTRLATSGVRVPFVMTLEARVRLGADNDHQAVDQAIGPGRIRKGEKMATQQLRQRLINSVFNPLRGILDVKDSLSVLSQGQVDRLTQLQRRTVAAQDSVWAPVVAYLANLPNSYNEEEVVAMVRDARMRAFDRIVDSMIEASKILTPEQIADFPPALRSSFDIEALKQQRPVKGFFPAF